MGTQEEKSATKLAAARGRRRLDFKRFLGKAMFLDLPGYRHAHTLEEELTARGATLETHFHSGVKYLITRTRNRDSKNPSQSPSTPSPNTPGTAKSSISQLVSPMTDHSPSDLKPHPNPAYHTRAQQMLRMSQGRGGRKADLISLARQWNCKVVTLEELLAELKRLKPLPSRDKSGNSLSSDSKHSKVRRLKAPFLKVEDISRCYRPLVLEMKAWPTASCNTSPKGSPFDPPHHHQGKASHDVHPAPPGGKQGGGGGGGGGGKDEGGTREGGREKRPGHCECCGVRFEDLYMHLSGTRHQEYACNEKNFASLDRLIAQGKSFQQFISELRSKERTGPQSSPSKTSPHSSTPPPSTSSPSHPGSVALVTLPTSVATPTHRRSPRNHPSPVPTASTAKNTFPLTASQTTPTKGKTTPTKRLKFSTTSEATPTPTKSLVLTTPTRRTRKRSPPSSASLQGSFASPASKRLKQGSPETCYSPEGVRRSPRLLIKQLAATS